MTDSRSKSESSRPTGSPGRPLFHVVLVEPEIPNNTGNIGRTCVTAGCALHLVHPLGFEVSNKACRRAGLDYWPRLDVTEHADWDAYAVVSSAPPARTWLFTTRTSRSVFDVEFAAGDHLVFGKESAGLPDGLIQTMSEQTVGFPMMPGERSINVSSVVTAAIYEGIRQLSVRNTIGISENLRILRG